MRAVCESGDAVSGGRATIMIAGPCVSIRTGFAVSGCVTLCNIPGAVAGMADGTAHTRSRCWYLLPAHACARPSWRALSE